MKNSVLIRPSINPKTPTSFAVFFYRDDVLIGNAITKNGSFVEVGRIVNGWCHHDLIPVDTTKKELPAKQVLQQVLMPSEHQIDG